MLRRYSLFYLYSTVRLSYCSIVCFISMYLLSFFISIRHQFINCFPETDNDFSRLSLNFLKTFSSIYLNLGSEWFFYVNFPLFFFSSAVYPSKNLRTLLSPILLLYIGNFSLSLFATVLLFLCFFDNFMHSSMTAELYLLYFLLYFGSFWFSIILFWSSLT